MSVCLVFITILILGLVLGHVKDCLLELRLLADSFRSVVELDLVREEGPDEGREYD